MSKSPEQKKRVSRAAESVMYDLEDLAPRQIKEAAADGKEEEAEEVAKRVEDLYTTLDDLMYDIKRVVEEAE